MKEIRQKQFSYVDHKKYMVKYRSVCVCVMNKFKYLIYNNKGYTYR